MAATHAKEAAFMHASSVSTAFMHSPGTSKPAPINDASEMEEALPPVDENTPLLLQLPPAEDWNLELRDWDSEDGDGGAPRTLGVLPLCGIIYFAVSGGPEGTEGLVRTGGPAGALVGLAVTALVWSLPIALLSTELATTVPQNGGPMVWSRAAWGAGTAGGDAIAFLAGWMSFLSTAVDAALYPSMFVSYLDAGFSLGMSDETQLWVKICFVVVLTAQNMGGAAAVGDSSVVMIVILLGPFVAFIFAAFGDLLSSPLHPANWFEAEPTTGQTEYLLLLLWNMGMWEAAASCAGEVKNPGYTFPRALALVMLLVFANYALPIMAFTGLDGDSAKYTNGYYITVAGKFGGAAFATAMAIGQSVSTMGLFTNGSSAALTPPNKACCPIPPPTRSSLLSSSNQHVQPRPPLLTGGSWVAQAGQELVLALRHGRADAASATLLLALGAHFCAVGLDPRLRFRHDADGVRGQLQRGPRRRHPPLRPRPSHRDRCLPEAAMGVPGAGAWLQDPARRLLGAPLLPPVRRPLLHHRRRHPVGLYGSGCRLHCCWLSALRLDLLGARLQPGHLRAGCDRRAGAAGNAGALAPQHARALPAQHATQPLAARDAADVDDREPAVEHLREEQRQRQPGRL